MGNIVRSINQLTSNRENKYICNNGASIEVTIDNIKHVQTPNLSKAKKDCRKKQIKSLYECVQELQNTEKITPKKRLNNYLDSADKACMNLREVIHMHQKRNIKLAAITEKFDKKIKKIKRNRCFEKIKLPPI